jgi:hypothetical protein
MVLRLIATEKARLPPPSEAVSLAVWVTSAQPLDGSTKT